MTGDKEIFDRFQYDFFFWRRNEILERPMKMSFLFGAHAALSSWQWGDKWCLDHQDDLEKLADTFWEKFKNGDFSPPAHE